MTLFPYTTLFRSPNDTATISATLGANLAAGGTVVFDLFASSDCSTASLYHQSITLTGGNPSETVSTTNDVVTTFDIATAYADAANSTLPSATSVYSWRVVYTPATSDTAHLGIQSSCSAEHFSITYTNDNGPGTALP